MKRGGKTHKVWRKGQKATGNSRGKMTWGEVCGLGELLAERNGPRAQGIRPEEAAGVEARVPVRRAGGRNGKPVKRVKDALMGMVGPGSLAPRPFSNLGRPLSPEAGSKVKIQLEAMREANWKAVSLPDRKGALESTP